MSISIDKTIENLRKNNMGAYFCKDEAEAVQLVRDMIKKVTP